MVWSDWLVEVGSYTALRMVRTGVEMVDGGDLQTPYYGEKLRDSARSVQRSFESIVLYGMKPKQLSELQNNLAKLRNIIEDMGAEDPGDESLLVGVQNMEQIANWIDAWKKGESDRRVNAAVPQMDPEAMLTLQNRKERRRAKSKRSRR